MARQTHTFTKLREGEERVKSQVSLVYSSVESVPKDEKVRKAANTGLGQRERTIENCRLSIYIYIYALKWLTQEAVAKNCSSPTHVQRATRCQKRGSKQEPPREQSNSRRVGLIPKSERKSASAPEGHSGQFAPQAWSAAGELAPSHSAYASCLSVVVIQIIHHAHTTN